MLWQTGHRNKSVKLVQLFKTFVESHRTLNGRTLAKKKYYLFPDIKKTQNHNTREKESKENALETPFEDFLNTLTSLKKIKDIVVVSGRTLHRWMKEFFPDTSISPHKEDYCNDCDEMQRKIESLKVKKQLHQVFIC